MTHSTYQSRARDQYSSHYSGGHHSRIQFGDFTPRQPASSPPQGAYPRQYRSVPSPSMSAVAPPQRQPAGYPQNVTIRRQPRRRRRSAQRSPRSYLLAGGSMLALAALVVGPKPLMEENSTAVTAKAVCQETIQAESVLSRAELSELLAIAERAPKADVQGIIAEPYCTLPSVEVREGVTAERVAYPLEFNPETWFIVLYEGEEYAGFDFSFSRD
jgi:hypothetical protein